MQQGFVFYLILGWKSQVIDCLLDMLEDVRPRFGLHFERLGDGNEGKHVGLPLLLDGLGDKMPNVNDVQKKRLNMVGYSSEYAVAVVIVALAR